jgi:hypothetical protein
MSENRKEDAERIVKEMEKETDLSKVEELIKDNSIVFEHGGKRYRIHLLNLVEKEELDQLRRKKFGQLLKDPDILLEKDLIALYKERGEDVEEIDEQIKKLDAEDLGLQVKLGEAISKNEGLQIFQTYKEQIQALIVQKQVLRAQKILLLEFSLENNLLTYVAQVITYLSLDEDKNGTWNRMFKSLADFQNYKDESLINQAAQYSMILQYM